MRALGTRDAGDFAFNIGGSPAAQQPIVDGRDGSTR